MEKEKHEVFGADDVAWEVMLSSMVLISLLTWKWGKPLGTNWYPGYYTSGLQGKVKAMDSEMLAVKRKHFMILEKHWVIRIPLRKAQVCNPPQERSDPILCSLNLSKWKQAVP